MTNTVLVSGSFDDLRSRQVRFLEEASKLGPVSVLLWTDAWVRASSRKMPKFPLDERRYLLEALRFVDHVTPVDSFSLERAVLNLSKRTENILWVESQNPENDSYQEVCSRLKIGVRMITDGQLAGFPGLLREQVSTSGRKKVVVTGCFDWLHSGHIRFFEEVSRLGDVYVIVGHNANVRLLKGPGHPLFSQEERRYMVGSVRHVTSAWISSGSGWMDAEPEIDFLRPDIYAVNEDGDKPEKRAFCDARGIEYAVLKRLPREGLPRRESTHLRGF
jgi:cytidyltransferase-like protein